MNTFADAGIYVIVDLSRSGNINGFIDGYDQMETQNYKIELIDSFANPPNLLAFRFAYSEQVPTDLLYVRASIRNLRKYMAEKWQRSIPILLDIGAEYRDLIDYMWCHDDTPDVLGIGIWYPSGCTTETEIIRARRFANNLQILSIVTSMSCVRDPVETDFRNFTFMDELYSEQGAAALSGGILVTYYGNWNSSLSWGLSCL